MDDYFALWFTLCAFLFLFFVSAVDGFLDAANLTLGDALSALALALRDHFHRFCGIFDRTRTIFICVWHILKTIACIYFEVFILFLWLILRIICLYPTLDLDETPSSPPTSTLLTSTTPPPASENEVSLQEHELALPTHTVYKHFPAYWSPTPTMSKAYVPSLRSQEVSIYDESDVQEYGMQYVELYGSRRLVPMTKEMLEETQDKTQDDIQLPDRAIVRCKYPIPSCII
jgi:hypothetical protein